MKALARFLCIVLCVSLSFSNSSLGEEPEKDHSLDFLDSVDYPELQVVPRASERIEAESATEKDGGAWLNQWGFLLGGSSTLMAATATNSALTNPQTYQQNAVLVSQSLGALTLGVGVYFALSQPYATAFEKTRKQKVTTKRQLLMRERASEEQLERIALQHRVISQGALLSNLVANGFLSTYGTQTSQVYCYGAMIIQLAALMFPNSYVTAWEKQNEYKHKIYSPLPLTGLQSDPVTGKAYPTVGMLWSW
jgi:hypothetical protein